MPNLQPSPMASIDELWTETTPSRIWQESPRRYRGRHRRGPPSPPRRLRWPCGPRASRGGATTAVRYLYDPFTGREHEPSAAEYDRRLSWDTYWNLAEAPS